MDNTRVVEPERAAAKCWRVCTGNSGRNFDTQADAERAADLCRVAFTAGREDMARDIKKLLGL